MWQEWWFVPAIFLYILLVVSILIYLLLLYRFRQQSKRQRMRNQISSDLHDDVGSTLSSIVFLTEAVLVKTRKRQLAEQTLSDIEPLLEEILANAQDTIESMRGIVMAIHPSNDLAIEFFAKLRVFAERLLSARQINCIFIVPDLLEYDLNPEQRRHLFLFFKEVFHNIVKHSKSQQVTVNIYNLKTSLIIKISDNGIGFDTNGSSAGHGMASLAKRAEELNANLEIISAKNAGTSIYLKFFHD